MHKNKKFKNSRNKEKQQSVLKRSRNKDDLQNKRSSEESKFDKKTRLLLDGKNLFFWNPEYRGSTKQFLEKLQPWVPKVKKILIGKKYNLDNEAEEFNIQEFNLPGITMRDMPRGWKHSIDDLACNLTEALLLMKERTEYDRKVRKAIRWMYSRRNNLKTNSISVHKIMSEKVERAQKWLQDTNEYYITIGMWQLYAVIKTYCYKDKTNECPDSFAFALLENLMNLFRIKIKVLNYDKDSLRTRIQRMINSADIRYKSNPASADIFEHLWNKIRERQAAIRDLL